MAYAQHPQGPITDLQPARLCHLCPGATLYLRDPRQTPVTLVSTEAQTASFTVKVADFEDAGAIWSFALWEVDKFQIAAQAPALSDAAVTALSRHIPALRQPLEVPCDPAQQRRVTTELAKMQAQVSRALSDVTLPRAKSDLLERTGPHDAVAGAWAGLVSAFELEAFEAAFATAFASNPGANEIIKAHRIVMAEMGLCPYQGACLRDKRQLLPPWHRPLRQRHILLRLSFLRHVFQHAGLDRLPLYRGVYAPEGITAPRNTGFVSATLRRSVAEALFDAGQEGGQAALYWQEAPVSRVFMTCLETPALSARYQEAEVVLLYDPENGLF